MIAILFAALFLATSPAEAIGMEEFMRRVGEHGEDAEDLVLGPYRGLIEDLEDELGEDPTVHALAEELAFLANMIDEGSDGTWTTAQGVGRVVDDEVPRDVCLTPPRLSSCD